MNIAGRGNAMHDVMLSGRIIWGRGVAGCVVIAIAVCGGIALVKYLFFR